MDSNISTRPERRPSKVSAAESLGLSASDEAFLDYILKSGHCIDTAPQIASVGEVLTSSGNQSSHLHVPINDGRLETSDLARLTQVSDSSEISANIVVEPSTDNTFLHTYFNESIGLTEEPGQMNYEYGVLENEIPSQRISTPPTPVSSNNVNGNVSCSEPIADTIDNSSDDEDAGVEIAAARTNGGTVRRISCGLGEYRSGYQRAGCRPVRRSAGWIVCGPRGGDSSDDEDGGVETGAVRRDG